MSLTQRSVTSVFWSMISNVAKVGILFARSVLLARLLPVEVFGVYSKSGAIVGLTGVVASFGLGSAFLHRTAETENEEHAAAVFFTLTGLLITAWVLLLETGTFIFAQGANRLTLAILTLTIAGSYLTSVAKIVLVRRIAHRRLSLLQMADAVVTTVVAVGLAYHGVTLWALLATDIITVVLDVIFLYMWRPAWRPRLVWDPPGMRYFLRFGSRQCIVNTLSLALDRVDDLWTGFFLGDGPLGFYARAYTFAIAPRQLLAVPVNAVSIGTYAELKNDRTQRSKAFFRTTAFLVYSGFFFAGLLTLIAPEMIRLLLGAKWLPMLTAFRLMLIFTLLDPIKGTALNLFVALGKPEESGRIEAIQLGFLIVGLFILGSWLGITGVALAVDLMLLIGIFLLLRKARAYVDFSLRKLFGIPILALGCGLASARGMIALPGIIGNDWRTGGIKVFMFSVIYGGLLVITQRRLLLEIMTPIIRQALAVLKK